MISLKNTGKICIDFVCIAECISRKRGCVSLLCVSNFNVLDCAIYYGIDIDGQPVLIINIALLFSISPD